MRPNPCSVSTLETNSYRPDQLLLQWHITERCDLRCVHCYQETYAGDELGFRELLVILKQFKELLSIWNCQTRETPIRAHITITGGEPFVRRDFFDLLEVFYAHRENFSFAILSNGTHIDAEIAYRLQALGVSFVQVSVEGTQSTHDQIRGMGNYKRTIAAIKHLVRADVRTLISFTAHHANFREFSDVAKLGRRLGVDRVWADRFIPQGGNGSTFPTQALTSDETRELFQIMEKARTNAERAWFNRTEIAMHRSLQFLVGGGRPYHCTAGDSLITVMPNGDLYPCRRMPIRVGNLLEKPLHQLYYCDLFERLRNPDCLDDDCRNCFYAKLCRGGLKCLSYAVTGDPFHADPGCWSVPVSIPR